jgi:hypothetical protein
MIPTFRRVVKRQYQIYDHSDIDDVLEYLSAPDLERGVIAKISRDTGIATERTPSLLLLKRTM